MNPQLADIHYSSSAQAKIALFRSLFRGREDVYPRRFESRRAGKSGYSPACANEWLPGICEKPRIKCAVCPHRRFLPVTDEVVRWHLSGRDDKGQDFVIGVYPMLLDESCFFLALDLDKQPWQEDALAILETCHRMDLPAAVERSRSGKRGHIWFFFESAIPASLARKLGSHILTETMEHRPEIGLDTYDRFYPNQDTLPHGGFGNLIALPFQKRARKLGNSVFLNESGIPYVDQWEFLASVRKIDRATVERIVSAAEKRGRVVGVALAVEGEVDPAPWNRTPPRQRTNVRFVGPIPERLELILANQIYIAKDQLSSELCNRLIRLAAFQNPEFYRAQAMRLPTYDRPRIIGCAENHAPYLSLPRGCWDDLHDLLREWKIAIDIRDERFSGDRLDVQFQGELHPDQLVAAQAMLAHDIGVLAATTAFGKTVVAAWLIAQRGVNALVLVHRRQLLEQWRQRLSMFLGLPTKAVGRIGGGHKKPTGSLDVAVIQSLFHRGEVDDRVAKYGYLIVDECHHVSAHSFQQVVRQSKARYVTGLSATVTRKDGHHPIIFMQCGPVRHVVDAKAQAAERPFEHQVIVRPTDFRPLGTLSAELRTQFQELYGQLIGDNSRNEVICEEVKRAVREGRCPLVLTERNEHLDWLALRLQPDVPNLIVLRGGMRKRELREALDRLASIPDSEPRVVLSTGQYVGEGFDDARLDTLFLTLPVSWKGTIAQYAGRLHRLFHSKREVRIYDFADLNVPMLARMFERRCRGYEAIGYRILVPGSAVADWPAEVSLPVDPAWKSMYGASLRRLVSDGVDVPLARLFARVVQPLPADEEGVARARSATEAFLYRRLESLPETAGLFCVNCELPIPFDGAGQMEVDFLCSQRRLVIEIDGPHHFANVNAYRRDRRKDMLLQQHGYFILRFLAEDVGKELDSVLDTIVRTTLSRESTLIRTSRFLGNISTQDPP